MNDEVASLGNTQLKTLPGISKGAIYVVVAEDDTIMVAIKPEAQMVYFDSLRRFFQIGFRIHVRPQEGKTLPIKEEVAERLNIGHLSSRQGDEVEGKPRYVGQCRIPACNLTLSPWVVQAHIVEGQLIEKLVDGLYERLKDSGLTILVPPALLLDMARERFLDMIPDNKVPLPEVKVYFGKESYAPPESDGPPKISMDTPGSPPFGMGEGDA